jgi:FtsP/CotA-like multicopper oxidase with cupredoxin domain
MNLTALPPGFVSGCKPSSAPREIVEVDSADKWVSLNFINAATLKAPEVAVDQHEMWIYEVDGQLITPIKTDIFAPYAGERYSAMVRLNQKPQDYPIRVPDTSFTQVVAEYAILRYKTERLPQETQTEGFYNLTYHGQETVPFLAYNGDVLNNATSLNESDIHPYPSWDPALRPARHGDQHFVFDITRVNTSWKTALNYPHLYPEDHDANLPLLYHPDDEGAYDGRYVMRTRNGTWVDIVLQLAAHPFWPADFPHAMHKHGNKVWLIGMGKGIWNYSSVDEAITVRPQDFNLVDPPYRDTFRNGFSGAEWMVLRYQVVQPGAWLFHCHIETHLAAGMGMAILDGVDAWPEIPPPYAVDQRGHWPEQATDMGALSAWPKDEKTSQIWRWIYHGVTRYWILVTVAFTLGVGAGAVSWRVSKSRKGYTIVSMSDAILAKSAAQG